jgi:ankyrin repeat protein
MNKTLLESAKDGNLERVRRMLLLGADINTRNVWNGTPLYLACMHGHTLVVFYLLSSGANVNLKTDSGRTALDIACTQEFEEIITILRIYDVEPLVDSPKKIEPLDEEEDKQTELLNSTNVLLPSRHTTLQRIYSIIKHLFSYGRRRVCP